MEVHRCEVPGIGESCIGETGIFRIGVFKTSCQRSLRNYVRN
jgi:hypothetical protein